MMKKMIIAILLGLFSIQPAFAWRTAIFDFDDRTNETDTIAKFIEAELKKADPKITVEQISGKGNESVSIEMIKKLEDAGYDLVIVITSDALIIAHHYLKKTPTIYTNVNNPLFLGFKTLDAPGKNMSGASYYVPVQKQLEFFKIIAPKMARIGFIIDKENKSKDVEVGEIRTACLDLNLTCKFELISDKVELTQAAKNLIDFGVEAVVATSSGKIYNNIQLFKSECAKSRVPIFSFHKNGVEKGAVAALASDYKVMAEKLVIPMALKVLKENISPGTFPAAFLNENFIHLNLTQAKEIGLTIPDEIIKTATKTY